MAFKGVIFLPKMYPAGRHKSFDAVRSAGWRTLTGHWLRKPVSVVRPDSVYLPAAWFYQNEFHSRLV